MRETISIIFVLLGAFMFFASVVGLFRFKYVLNRLNATGLADTTGIGFIIFGIIIYGVEFYLAIKLILVLGFFWITTPIAVHMIGQVEILTNPNHKERSKEK